MNVEKIGRSVKNRVLGKSPKLRDRRGVSKQEGLEIVKNVERGGDA